MRYIIAALAVVSLVLYYALKYLFQCAYGHISGGMKLNAKRLILFWKNQKLKYKTAKVKIEQKSLQHRGFPGGHPSKY